MLGATGAVGSTILEILAERDFPASEVVPFASERSAGQGSSSGAVDRCTVPAAERRDDPGPRHRALLAGGSVSAEWAPRFVEAGAVVVDNTSYWRMHEDVPLVVAGVNDEAAEDHKGIVANPNCTTMVMMMALAPIHRAVGLERLVVSSYQAVSGTGQKAIEELRAQSRAIAGRRSRRRARGLPAPDRLQRAAPGRDLQGRRRLHDRGAQGDGRDAQDPRLRRGGRRSPRPAPACRSSVGHSESINVQTREDLSPEDCRALLAEAPGVPVVDDPADGDYPMAIDAAGHDDVLVGRIRRDPSHERSLNLWLVGDNLRKGAATNAVQVAELLIERDLLG